MSKRTTQLNWLSIDICLAIGLTVWTPALSIAIALTTVSNLWFMANYQGNSSFPVQVRFIYLTLLVIGQLPYCQWINWIQLFGTTALLTVDYCPLARLLTLTPMYRQQPLSWQLVRNTFLTPPVNGSFLQTVQPSTTTQPQQ